MEKDLDPDVIKATQISLGKYVKRPPLNEKLLKKPPFRFLHDIFTTVLKTTGFFENLFEPEELISENVKDRDSKISFLNKVIFVITSTTGKSLSVKSSKIVAGQEPEKTNELLQCLAAALDKKLTSNEAVQKYIDSLKTPQVAETKTKEPNKSARKGNETKKLTSKSNEKLTSQKSEANIRSTSKQDKVNDTKTKRKENISNKNESQPKKSQQSKRITKQAGAANQNQSNEIQIKSKKPVSNTIEKEDVQEISQLQNTLGKVELIDFKNDDFNVFEEKDNHSDIESKAQQNTPRPAHGEETNLNNSYTTREQHLNLTLTSHDLTEPKTLGEENNTLEINLSKELNVHDVEINKQNDDNPKTLQTSIGNQNNIAFSDMPDKNNDELQNKTKDIQKPDNQIKSSHFIANITRPPSVRPSSSRPGAPRMREKLDNAIRDTDNLLLGKVNIIVENTQNEEDEDTSLVIIDQQIDLNEMSKDQQELNPSSNQHGHLVQQILESQMELSQITGKTEIEWQFGAQKAREAVNQEVEQLRFNIQGLSRVANPLGKLLDHMQEDVEVMRQELQQWTKIYDDVTKEIHKQKTINEDSLLPLHTKFKQLDVDIVEKHDKINDLKILIYKNAFRIEKLLASGNVQ